MENFSGRIAVITGAGSGIGRALAFLLAAEDAHLALLDINPEAASETARLCGQRSDRLISWHGCDVADPAQVDAVAGEVCSQHQTDHVHLLINNAGIGSTESFLEGDREAWERTFNICWGGVYNCSRAFVPLVVAADQGHVVNVSSINGFWASIGPSRPHTSYSAAKFAVKGFTEALIGEFRLLAPHVNASVVMPGHIGTDLVRNSRSVLGRDEDAESLEAAAGFRNVAPTSPDDAAQQIVDGVKQNRWRILVGHDAEVVDQAVRADPEGAYEPEFVDRLHQMGVLEGLVS